VAESVTDFLAREYEYLRAREGVDFFLALAPYTEALNSKRRLRRALKRLEREMRDAAQRYVDDQNEFVAEAKRIRHELAERAPEIDNSNMERPDYRTHAYMSWELDSFAGFDDLVERDARLQIGYPAVPGDRDDPGISPASCRSFAADSTLPSMGRTLQAMIHGSATTSAILEREWGTSYGDTNTH